MKKNFKKSGSVSKHWGQCKKCGKYYTTFAGSIAHSLGHCDKMKDRKNYIDFN